MEIPNDTKERVVDCLEQAEILESIAEVLEFLRGEHRDFFKSLDETKED